GMPAVVIRYEREGRVTNLRLARELRLLQVSHADDVHAPRAIDIRLRHSRESRPFHAQISPAAMRLHVRSATRLLQHITQTPTNRMCKRNVRDNPFAKERRLPHAPARPIEKLIGNHHIQRRILLLQRTNRRSRENTLDTKQLHRIDVRAKRNFCRRQAMTTPVSRKESNALTFQFADDERIRRWSKRSVNFDFFDGGQLRHLVQTAATDNADANSCCFTHESS